MDAGTESEPRGEGKYLYSAHFSTSFTHRLDRSASLLVDNGETVTGRAPGYLSQLNTKPILYLGNNNNPLLSQLSRVQSIHFVSNKVIFLVAQEVGHFTSYRKV